MGYWSQNKQGHSFATDDGEMIWGDGPADHIDDGIAQAIFRFTEDVGRPPTFAELKAGLSFSLGGLDGVLA